MTRVGGTFRSDRGPILVAMMVTNGLVAANATLLATTVPAVVADLGGLTLFPWLFSLYLLAQAVSIPVYAKLADILGRKPVILFGIGLFTIGSVLCGLAWSMPALIALRAVQGLGAGAIHPIAVTIVGDLYTVRERAGIQGYLAGAWGLGSLAGPLLGGLLAELGAWRAAFLLTLPLCAAIAALLVTKFHEKVARGDQRIDWAGAAILTVALTLLVLGVLKGGASWAWWSPPSVACLGGGAALLAMFVVVERRMRDPVVPLWLFTRRLVASAAVVSIGAGAIVTGLATYIPIFLIGSLDLTPILAALALSAFMVGWPLAAATGTRSLLRFGFRLTVVMGAAVMVAGAAILVAFASRPAVLTVVVACFVLGLGLGLAASPSLVAAQASVDWGDRGVVSGTIMFCRLLGSALGIAAFGALGNGVLHRAGDDPGPTAFADVGLAVFSGIGVAALLSLAAALVLPRDRPRPALDGQITERSL